MMANWNGGFRLGLYLGLGLLAGLQAGVLPAYGTAELPVEQATLADAPQVPPPITRRSPARVIVKLDVQEVVAEIAPGVQYPLWTYGGRVPGKFIRVRQGDRVEFHLINRSANAMPHNIDLHAVSGPGGGAKLSLVAPGEEAIFEWQPTCSGLFVYHCASAPVPMHIASGMFGAILVEPPEGLPKVDHEFYVAQSEFYTRHALAGQGPAAEKAAPSRGRYEFSFEKMLDERPDYVLWNGRIGSLTNQNALQVRAGERVRLFVVNGGLNLTSSFHVIGGFLDQVWEGALDQPPLRGVATRAVPAGGAIVVDTRLDAPGAYFLVDHALSRSFNKGCVGVINVTGEPRADLLRFLAKRPLDDAPAAAALPALAASKPAGGSYHKLTGARAGSDLAALGRCAACHDLSPVGKRFYGPPLFGVYGRKPSIDGVPFPRWDQAALDAWLKAPNRIKPDTSMTFHVGDEIKRAEIIEALEQLK